MKTPIAITCICCPIGCNLTITKLDNNLVITGNKCGRGKKYALEEMTAPKRIVTSTVKITNSQYPVVPVKTALPVLKEKIFTIMQILANVKVVAPVHIGDIIVKNIADTGIDVIATKSQK